MNINAISDIVKNVRLGSKGYAYIIDDEAFQIAYSLRNYTIVIVIFSVNILVNFFVLLL